MMGNISSINFKKSIGINTAHNDRTLAPNYLISDVGCECNRNDEEARELKKKIIKEAITTYTNRVGQRFQGKNFEWSAVVNIKPNTTMQDLEKLAEHFEKKYGFQCYQIAIHRDEGHINEQGEKVINHHSHLEFVMLDKETGKTNFKLRDFNKQKIRDIQTEVAQILQMQRGEDKRISHTERVEPRKYAALKESEKKEKNKEIEKLTKKAVGQELEKVRKSLIGKGYGKSIFRDLNSLKQGEYTADDLSLAIDEILKKYENDVLVENRIHSQSNGNGSRTNENDLNDKSIVEDEKIILNSFKIDLKANLENHTNKEIVKTGFFKQEEKIVIDNPNSLFNGILTSFSNGFDKFFELAKAKAKAYYEDIIQKLKNENEILKEKNKELQDKNFIHERKIKKLEEQNKSLRDDTLELPLNARKNIKKTDLDEIKEKLKEKKETDYSIRRNR